MDEPPQLHTTLREFPWVLIRFRCHHCERGGDSRLADCVVQFGARAKLSRLLRIFIRNCPHDPHGETRRPQKYGSKCGGYMPDIGRQGPPDHPPAMTGLTLIEGGKRDMLPAHPQRAERRRRIGEAEDA